jgi:hypothetical protein
MTDVKIDRALVKDLIDMVLPGEADDALVPELDTPRGRTWGIKIGTVTHMFEFFVALGLMAYEDPDDRFAVDDAREIAQLARPDHVVAHGGIVLVFPGVQLVGD